jgi:hypothetical protein
VSLEPITGADLEAEVQRLHALLEGKSEYVDCICPGCPRKVPEAWASGMCQPCCEEDCEHSDGAKAALAAVIEHRGSLLTALQDSFRDCYSCMQLPGKKLCDRCEDAQALIRRIEDEGP